MKLLTMIMHSISSVPLCEELFKALPLMKKDSLHLGVLRELTYSVLFVTRRVWQHLMIDELVQLQHGARLLVSFHFSSMTLTYHFLSAVVTFKENTAPYAKGKIHVLRDRRIVSNTPDRKEQIVRSFLDLLCEQGLRRIHGA